MKRGCPVGNGTPDNRKPFAVTARIRVTLDVLSSSRWGEDCTVDQVRKQSAREAVEAIRSACESKSILDGRINIIGDPEVTVVSFKDEKEVGNA